MLHIDHGKNIDIPNADGKTPKDLANMYKSEEDRQRFLLILNRESSLTQNIGSNPMSRKKNMPVKNSNTSIGLNPRAAA